ELDDSAAIISYEEYYPYGSTSFEAVSGAIEVSAKRYRYTGKERDEETGFNYHDARYYGPWLGRWTATDPKGALDSTNLYGYCRGNPVRLCDRNGTQSICDPEMTSCPDTKSNNGDPDNPNNYPNFEDYEDYQETKKFNQVVDALHQAALK